MNDRSPPAYLDSQRGWVEGEGGMRNEKEGVRELRPERGSWKPGKGRPAWRCMGEAMRVEKKGPAKGQMSPLPNRRDETLTKQNDWADWKEFFFILRKKVYKNLTPNYIIRLCLTKEQIGLSRNSCTLLEALMEVYSGNFIHFPHCIWTKQTRETITVLIVHWGPKKEQFMLKYYSMISYCIVLYYTWYLLYRKL